LTRILALDTSTWREGISLLEWHGGDEPPESVAEVEFDVRDSHAVRLVEGVDRLLVDAGWARADLDGYVATRGPGSFTGIRIGLGTVCGLALASGRPAAGVVSLHALAETLGPADGDRVAVIGAGRGEVYHARYDAGSTPPLEAAAPRLGTLREACDDAPPNSVFVFAAGCETQAEEAARRVSSGRVIPRSPSGVATAAGRLALLGGAFRGDAGSTLTPLYLRPPDAELKRN